MWAVVKFKQIWISPKMCNTIILVKRFFFKNFHHVVFKSPVAEFKEFERRFKFKPRLKYGWFHLKVYQMFQDLSQRLI